MITSWKESWSFSHRLMKSKIDRRSRSRRVMTNFCSDMENQREEIKTRLALAVQERRWMDGCRRCRHIRREHIGAGTADPSTRVTHRFRSRGERIGLPRTCRVGSDGEAGVRCYQDDQGFRGKPQSAEMEFSIRERHSIDAFVGLEMTE